MKKSIIILGGLFLLVIASLNFIFAAHTTSPTSLTVNQSQNYLFNITLNNSYSYDSGGNITQVNITLPPGFVFVTGTNGTNSFGSFTTNNTLLTWTNESDYLINSSINNTYFWFTATVTSTLGSYNLTVTSFNGTGVYSTNITLTVNDITPPLVSIIAPVSLGNYSGALILNASVNDTTNGIGVSAVYFNITNATSADQKNVSFASQLGSTVYWNVSLNISYLPDGLYNLTVYANDSSNNLNSTVKSQFTIDNTAPVLSLSSSAARTSLNLTLSATDTTGLNGTYTINRTGATVSGLTLGGFTITETGLTCGTSYSYNITCYDQVGLLGTIIQSFSTSACAETVDTSGTGGTTTTTDSWTSTYLAPDADFAAGFARELAVKNRVKVMVDSTAHYVGIIALTSTQATINISSTPQQAIFNIGDEKKFDVDDDKYYEVYVKLNSINNSNANVTIKQIYEKINSNTTAGSAPAGITGNGTAPGNTNSSGVSGSGVLSSLSDFSFFSKILKSFWFWLAFAIIVLVVAAFIYGSFLKKRYYSKGIGKKPRK